MKLLALIIIVNGALYVYNEMPDAPVRKVENCRGSVKKNNCPYKDNADTRNK